jgi:hypothetical protein
VQNTRASASSAEVGVYFSLINLGFSFISFNALHLVIIF